MKCHHNAGYVEIHITSGFWLCQKRFSQGRLAWWPDTAKEAISLRASELHILLAQGDPIKASLPKDWRCINTYAANESDAPKLS